MFRGPTPNSSLVLGLDCLLQFLVADGTLRRLAGRRPRNRLTGRMCIPAQSAEHNRLDPEPLLMLIDELDNQRCGRSSFAAKKTDAAFNISFARRNSRFSAFSFRTSNDSADVTPGRSPASTWTFRTQLSKVCAEPIPSFDATDSMAA